jgi:hypothetical protein
MLVAQEDELRVNVTTLVSSIQIFWFLISFGRLLISFV